MSKRVAIVAGAGGDLGLVTAQKLAAAGFTVAARPGLEPAAGMAAYTVSEAALVRLVRMLDPELRPRLAYSVPPEAVADLIAYLVSDAAAPVSGAIVPACGA